MKTACIAVILLLLPTVAIALAPSEILYNPAGTDTNQEFIELVGNETLTGCTVRDLSSADTLELLQPATMDSKVILIVESDSPLANLTTDAAVYGAGLAIGNGLANTAERIDITCDGTVLLTTEYNVSLLPSIPDGAAIIWNGTGWTNGSIGGTPGIADWMPKTQNEEEPAGNQTEGLPPQTRVPEHAPCNTSLSITIGTNDLVAGELFTFSVWSEEYASWEAVTIDGVLAYGDTLRARTHAFTVPNNASEVRLIAESRACGGRQRAIRELSIAQQIQPPAVIPSEPPNRTTTDVPRTEPVPPKDAANKTSDMTVPVQSTTQRKNPAVITGQVVVDEDTAAIPWISAFGIVTVIASAGVFLTLHRREQAKETGGKYIRTRSARNTHGDARREAGQGTTQARMDQSNRDL